MKTQSLVVLILAFALLGFGCSSALAQDTVSVTPVGSHEGEFCRNDRALIFEDPEEGLRILYDPGRTVMGSTDPRLGDIDVMLLSHVHSDHLGDRVPSALNAGDCGAPDTPVLTTPNSNFAKIAAAKNATVYVGGEMHTFLGGKIAAEGGTAGQAQVLRPGAKRTMGGVTFATVRALHSNGVPSVFLSNPPTDNLTAYVGPEEGYVISFSNGLVVYLSGDTGVTSDMENVVRKQYGAELAVINIGDIFSTGPEEAAYAVNELIKPKSVIPSHANEEATENGVVLPGTKTELFMNLVGGAKVHVPLSGMTMEFDANGKCISGC